MVKDIAGNAEEEEEEGPLTTEANHAPQPPTRSRPPAPHGSLPVGTALVPGSSSNISVSVLVCDSISLSLSMTLSISLSLSVTLYLCACL